MSHAADPTHAALLACLPHGPGFRFVDTILDLEPGARGTGRWSPRGDEPFFAGHFPGNPIVPGVLVGEALAQMAGIVGHATPEPGDHTPAQGALAQIDLRMRNAVAPPADIDLHVTLTRRMGPLAQFDVRAESGGKLVARGGLTIAAQVPVPA